MIASLIATPKALEVTGGAHEPEEMAAVPIAAVPPEMI
jgi:hypothetical protein